jgi:predicted phage-related endonuclease
MSAFARSIPDRATWLAMRQDYLTASDIGAAAGLDEYKSPLRLYAEKQGTVPNVAETSTMRRGLMFEAAAIAYLQADHPDWKIERPNKFYCDDALLLGCTPDALVHVDGVMLNCQIKTIGLPAYERWHGVPPLKYQLQVACENMLTNSAGGILAVLVVSTFDAFVQTFDVPRHPDAEAAIVNIAKDFWASVDAGHPPAADYARDADTLAALFPPRHDVPVPLDLSQDNRIGPLLARRELLKAVEKRAKERAEALDAELVEKLAGAELAIAPGWKITRKLQTRPEKLVKASTFPVMKITRLKEDAA